MKMDIVAGSQNDEFYTPKYAITPLVPYLKNKSNIKTIWCPFDTVNSNYVKVLKDVGYNVIYTHVSTGNDFFSTHVDCDCIVSNPPFSKKNEVLDNVFSRNIPFALLFGSVGLLESKLRYDLFSTNTFEILAFDKRISFFRDYYRSRKKF